MRLLSVVCVLAASAALSTCTAGDIPAVDIGTGALTSATIARTSDGMLVVGGRLGSMLVYSFGTADGALWQMIRLPMPSTMDQTAELYPFATYNGHPRVTGCWRGSGGQPCLKPLWEWRGQQQGWLQETSTDWTHDWEAESFTRVLGGYRTQQTEWTAGRRLLANGVTEHDFWHKEVGGYTWYSSAPITGDLPAPPKLHDRSPDGTVWATAGNTLWRLSDTASGKPLPPGCTEVLALDAPTNTDLLMLWRDANLPTTTPYAFSHSVDGGKTWTLQACHALRTTLMDFATGGFGILAFKMKQAGAIGFWKLWVTDNTGRDWATYELPPEYDVLGLQVPALGEAFILAQCYDDSRLYCLHYTTSLLPGADAAIMIPTTPGGAASTTTPMKPGTVLFPRSAGPTLSWWGQGSFVDCGVKPKSGPVTNANGYQFRIVYTHPENKPPRRINVEVQGITRQWAMKITTQYGTNYQKGAVYDGWVKPSELPAGKKLKYRFNANDGKGDAAGIPTQWDNGRFFTTQ